MRAGSARILVVAAAGLWLAGCSSSGTVSNPFEKLSNPFASTPGADANASVPPDAAEVNANALAPTDAELVPPQPRLYGGDPNDDLNLGKKQYRANNFGVAEKHFRRAVESHPRDAEAWLGLAACYDRLRRFELADRAYKQAILIVGPSAEILNNQGYSYMLRGDYKRARATLTDAQRKDPRNKFVANNLQLLEESYRQGKAIE
jgi:tetratricopeptide (TPR) repeat protein